MPLTSENWKITGEGWEILPPGSTIWKKPTQIWARELKGWTRTWLQDLNRKIRRWDWVLSWLIKFVQDFRERGAYQEFVGRQWEADGGLPDADAGETSENRMITRGSKSELSWFQTKTALDMEISLYRKLLESEEDRLGMDSGKKNTESDILSDIWLFRSSTSAPQQQTDCFVEIRISRCSFYLFYPDVPFCLLLKRGRSTKQRLWIICTAAHHDVKSSYRS